MLLRKIFHVLLLIFVEIFTISCEKKTSLTFVIDNTGSMRPIIEQIIKEADAIMDIINNKLSPIENVVLVTFDDTHAQLRTKTKNRDEFKNSLKTITLTSSGDCPEMSLSGLQLALEESLPGSYMFVFTDATAKDPHKIERVKDLSHKKQSQVIFVLTGILCNFFYPYGHGTKWYPEIATASSGQEFHLSRLSDVTRILLYMKEMVRGERTILATKVIPRFGIVMEIPFTVDKQMEYVIISVSGKRANFVDVGRNAKRELILTTHDVKVIKLVYKTPGNYVVKVRSGSTVASVVISGRTNFIFQHGFSAMQPKSITDTSKQPISGDKSHISIYVTNPGNAVQVNSLQIVDMSGKSIKEMALKKVSENVYITEPNLWPENMFKIAVKGTGVIRFANTPIRAQNPRSRISTPTAPKVVISEGSKISTVYGGRLQLTCKVTAYPKPNIVWKDNKGSVITSKSALIEIPNYYISYMNLENVRTSKKYYCHVENTKGKATATIDVAFTTPFTVKENLKADTNIEYGKEITLKCKITSSQPMQISWWHASSGKNERINTSDKYIISKDGTELKLKSVDLKLAGKYSCTAYLQKDPIVTTTFNTNLKVVGLVAPQIQKQSAVNKIKENTAVYLPCKMLKGNPKPNISWQFKSRSSDKFQALAKTGDVLRFGNVKLQDSGYYKCIAENVAGKTEQITELNVEAVPVIEKQPTVITIKENKLLSIICKIVKANPKPKITWQFKNRDSNKFQTLAEKSETLRVTNVKLTNSGYYKCVAENAVGRAEQNTEVIVQVSPQIEKQLVPIKVKEDKPAEVKCKILKGNPKPKITWQFKSPNSDKYQTLNETSEILRIPKVKILNSGQYKCVAENVAGRAEQILNFVAEVAPQIEKQASVVKLKENSILVLPCKILRANPKAKIIWQFKKQSSDKFQTLSEIGDVLRVASVKVPNSGHYKCVAENEAGRAEQTTELIVEAPPQIEKQTTVIKTKEKALVAINCKILKGIPKPKITWHFKSSSSDKFQTMTETGELLRVADIKLHNSGYYKCVAQNAVGQAEQTTEIIVEVLPVIEKQPTVITIKENKPLGIICKIVKANPKPKITWQFKNRGSDKFQTLSEKNETLRVADVKLTNSGYYKCVAENAIGRAEQITEVIVQVSPQIEKQLVPIKVKEDKPAEVKCKILKGNPKPKITWQFKSPNSDKYQTLNETSEILRIPKVKILNSGQYKCVAENVAGRAEQILNFVAEVAPQIEKQASVVKLKENSILVLPCKILRANPKAKIIWQFKKQSSDKFQTLSEIGDVLRVASVKVPNSGHYKCVAENEAGRAEQTTELIVEAPPQIEKQTTVIKTKEKALVAINCKILKGIPKPKITWHFKSSSSDKFQTMTETGELLRVADIKLHNSGYYKCVAQNAVGQAEQTTEIIVEVLPVIEKQPTVITIKENKPLGIICKIVKANPKPKITWQFKNRGSDKFQTLSEKNETLRVADVKLTNSGYYKCVAENAIGRAEQITEVIVQVSPQIEKQLVPIKVKEDKPAEVKCKILKGNPKPKITWQFKSPNSDKYQTLNETSEILRIPKVKILNSGQYKCVAENVAGRAEQILNFVAEVAPQIEKQASVVKLKENSILVLPCKILRANPKAKIIWQFKKQSSDKFQTLSEIGDVLRVASVKVPNSGHYKCVAENEAGRAEQTTELIVEAPPQIEKQTTVIKTKEKALVAINCKILKGIPKPKITWHYKSSSSDKFQTMTETGELLRVADIKLHNSGYYKCVAQNAVGQAEQTTEIIVEVAPLIEKHAAVIKIKEIMPAAIQCKIQKGNPKPNITWQFKRRTSDKFQTVNETGDVLNIADSTLHHSGYYKCVVENVVGRDELTVELIVEAAPQIEKQTSSINIRENKTLIISCKIRKAYPRPKIIWQFKSQNSGKVQPLSVTGDELRIVDMKLYNSGHYKCVAENTAGRDEQTTEVIVEVIPQIEKQTSLIKVKDSATLIIPCKILKANPKPKITWQFKSLISNKFELLAETSDVLRITDVKLHDSGHYKCVVENIAGQTELITDVIIEVAPQIEQKTPHVEIKENTPAVLQCKILNGNPKPTITWQYKGQGSDKFITLLGTGEVLNITDVKLQNSGYYKCVAENIVGQSEFTFEFTVKAAPQIENQSSVIKIKEYAPLVITCKILKASPKPRISWQFMSENSDKFLTLAETSNVLRVSDMKLHNSGHYRCVAENDVGRAEQITEVIVEVIPKIKKQSGLIKTKENTAVVMQCKIIKGNPKPKMTWHLKNQNSDKIQTLAETGEVLYIADVKLHNSGQYKCVAKNVAGQDEQIIELIVEVPPLIEKQSSVIKMKENKTLSIPCKIFKANPKPKITWQFMSQSSDKFQILTETGDVLHIANVKLHDSGHYRCVAENSAGRAEQTTEVVVEAAPQIQKQSALIKVKENTPAIMQCIILLGNPKPKITWQFKNSDTYKTLPETNEVLFIADVKLRNSGHYRCIAENVAGQAEQTTELIVEAPPQIAKYVNVVKIKENSSLVIPCTIINANPTPTITWQFMSQKSPKFQPLGNTGDVLHISDVKLHNSGHYKCVAENVAGRSEQTIELIIEVSPQIEQNERLISVNENTSIVIPCKIIKGNPKPMITWQFKSQSSDKFQTLNETAEVLYTADVKLRNAGQYKCVAENVAGRAEQNIELIVEVAPQFEKQLPIIRMKEHASLTIPCKPFKSNSKLKITWQFMNQNSNKFQTLLETGDVLHIADVTLLNSGHYKCIAENAAGRAEQMTEVIVETAPQIQQTSLVKIKENMPAVIQCKILKGNPKPKITWHFKSQNSDQFQILSETGEVLYFADVSLRNSGQYMCLAENIAGRAKQVTDFMVEVPPQIEKQSDVIKIKENTTLIIPCKILKANPKPNIAWQFMSDDSFEFQTLTKTGDVLQIAKVKFLNSGLYKCVAENLAGRAEQTTGVIVEAAPQIKQLFPFINIKENTPVVMQCKILKGNPKPKITWYFKSEKSDKFQILSETGEVLYIADVSLRNSGQYKCVAQNIAGLVDQTTELIVEVPPRIQTQPNIIKIKEKTTLDIPCKILEANPKPKIIWQYMNQSSSKFQTLDETDDVLRVADVKLHDSGYYRCVAENNAGRAEQTTEVIVESAPQIKQISVITKIKENMSAVIQCKILQGNPKPNITWQFKSGNSEFKTLTETGEVLFIQDAKLHNSGHYRCVAENVAGRDDQTTELIVGVAPQIEKQSKVINTKENKPIVIPCKILKANPKPKITWQFMKQNLDKFESLTETGDVLHIADVTLHNSGHYKCVVENDAGRAEQITEVFVEAAPYIEKKLCVLKINEHSSGNVHCQISKGNPKPNITWHFKNYNSSKFRALDITDEELQIANAKIDNSGYYKCIAENHVGRAEKICEIIVQTPARIILDNDKLNYEAVVGDTVLRIPCHTVGYPKPTVTWNVNSSSIGTGKYSIENGELIINKPSKEDINIYTCNAVNEIGTDEKIFNVFITDYINDLSDIQKVYILKGDSKKLKCPLPHIDTDTVRWYLNGEKLDVPGPDMHLKKSAENNDGNYTCRVSSRLGSKSSTLEVDVGYPPQFMYKPSDVIYWNGESDILNCIVREKPLSNIEWLHNGKMVKGANTPELDITDWGHYTCRVRNVHGTVERSFNITSDVCLINRSWKTAGNMPLIMTKVMLSDQIAQQTDEEIDQITDQQVTEQKTEQRAILSSLSWPDFQTEQQYFVIQQRESLHLFCRNPSEHHNSFKIFPNKSEIEAVCDYEDNFLVDGNLYKYSELQCKDQVTAVIKRTGRKCKYDKNSEGIHVGFDLDGFLDIFEVCFDTNLKVPHYVKTSMSIENMMSDVPEGKWYKFVEISGDGGKEDDSCGKNSKCCYAKTQLVNARDVTFGPAQAASFVDNLNAVPVWQPCNETNASWKNIEERIRYELQQSVKLTVWSGASDYRNINGRMIPRYLWKVMQEPYTMETATVVYVNDPKPVTSDRLCTDICNDVYSMQSIGWPVYCCSLPEFMKAFQIPENTFQEKAIKNIWF